jgi:hypothetical protein
MNIGILLTGNLVGGGVKMPVRLASALAADHDVTLLYPRVPHYVTYQILRRTRWVARARFIARQALHHRGDLFFQQDLDSRVRIERYVLVPHRRQLNDFDFVVYQSVWQHYELGNGPRPGRRIHWSLADYLFCSGLNGDVGVTACRSEPSSRAAWMGSSTRLAARRNRIRRPCSVTFNPGGG